MKTRLVSLNLLVVAVCLACLTASAAEIHVTPGSAGIQAAIESAADGDEIIVAPGVYQEHINFLGKAITVRSTDPDDPGVVAATIIDGTGTGRCVTFENDEGPDSVLAGLTITNGNAQGEDYERYGGGVFCHVSSPTIVGNFIIANTGETRGGGICAYWGSPLITGNTISGNRAYHGGGIYSDPSGNFNPLSRQEITGNVITGNTASGHGGGIYATSTYPLLASGNTIAANSAGGGVYCRGGDVILTENMITGNVGGGIRLYDVDAILTRNLVAGNYGGMRVSDSDLFMVGDVIAGNLSRTGISGDAMWLWETSALIFNVVITQNYANEGSAMTCRLPDGGKIIIRNSIIWGNYQTKWVPFEQTTGFYWLGSQGDDQPIPYPNGLVLVIDSIISWALGPIDPGGVAGGPLLYVYTVSADPLFVDPGHWDDNGTPDDYDDDFFVMGDYHLLPGSPCIDAGTNDIDDTATEAIEELPETDFGGLPRIMDGDGNGTLVVDMGAYEYLPGDVNYDGKLNVLDLLHVRNSMGKDPSSDPAARRADVNADGNVDIMDLIAVRNLLSEW